MGMGYNENAAVPKYLIKCNRMAESAENDGWFV